MSFPFKAVMDGDKRIVGSPAWSEPTGTDRRLRFVAPLLFKGRVMQGLELVGRAHVDLPHRDLSLTLIYMPTSNRRGAIQMARVDWRPKVSHANDHPRCPPHLLGVDLDGDHHHSFELNWSTGAGRLLMNLPIAEPINPQFQSFEELVDGVGALFKIENAATSIPSPWPPDLFTAHGL